MFFVLLPLNSCINSNSLFCCRGAENLPTILSAGYKVLVFLRRGSAVVVEVAPEPSLFFSNTFFNFSICWKNSQTFALLHSTQKCNSFAPSCMQQSKMQGPGYFLKHWIDWHPLIFKSSSIFNPPLPPFAVSLSLIISSKYQTQKPVHLLEALSPLLVYQHVPPLVQIHLYKFHWTEGLNFFRDISHDDKVLNRNLLRVTWRNCKLLKV